MDAYLTARERVVAAGYAEEIDWQDQLSLDKVTESDFLREAAWVILSSGMRESVIRRCFASISRAFLSWYSAEEIVRRRSACVRSALQVFRHTAKIEAIGDVAAAVARDGFPALRERMRLKGVEELQLLPFIGPVTQFHLAKNIGLDVVKPDRHLVRIAHAAGFAEPASMCRLVADATGDRIATVDIVFWRFATLQPDYVKVFTATALS